MGFESTSTNFRGDPKSQENVSWNPTDTRAKLFACFRLSPELNFLIFRFFKKYFQFNFLEEITEISRKLGTTEVIYLSKVALSERICTYLHQKIQIIVQYNLQFKNASFVHMYSPTHTIPCDFFPLQGSPVQSVAFLCTSNS